MSGCRCARCSSVAAMVLSLRTLGGSEAGEVVEESRDASALLPLALSGLRWLVSLSGRDVQCKLLCTDL